MAQAARDQNKVTSLIGVSSADGTTPIKVKVNPSTGAILATLSGGSGTVTSVSVVTANGVSGSVATATTTPAITLTLGAITPTTVNGNTITTGTGTLTLGAGSTLATSATNSITLTSVGATNVTLPTAGTLATLAGSEALTNKSLNGMTVTSSTGTFTLTNSKTLTVSDSTTLATNSITFAGGEVLTLTATNALTLTTTGSTNVTLPTTGTLATLAGTEVLTNKDLTATNNSFTAASTTQTGVSELAIASEVNTGTDATRSITPDALAGSNLGTQALGGVAFAFTTDVTTGDGKLYIPIPAKCNGMNLIRAQAYVVTAGTTNATTVMVHNLTQAADMLSGAISIASGGTVGTVGTIDTGNDDVATDNIIRIDVDSVSTTAPKGLLVMLEFQLP